MDERYWKKGSKDGNGDSREVRIMFPADLVKRMEIAVATKAIPARTISDLVRSLSYSGFDDLEKSGILEDTGIALTYQIEADIDELTARPERERRHVDSLISSLFRARTPAAKAKAVRLAESYLPRIEDVELASRLRDALNQAKP